MGGARGHALVACSNISDVLDASVRRGNGLAGLKEISIWILGIDKDAEDCGLKRDTLETSLNLPIRAYTKLVENVKSLKQSSLILEVFVLKGKSLCATNIELRLENYMPIRLPHQSDTYYATVTIYRNKHILTFGVGDPGNVPGSVETLAKKFALDGRSRTRTE
jgi:hypothetical protein